MGDKSPRAKEKSKKQGAAAKAQKKAGAKASAPTAVADVKKGR